MIQKIIETLTLTFVLLYASPILAQLCPSHPGAALPDEGTGACTGNVNLKIPLPLVDLMLVYNSNGPQFDYGFGKGWRISLEQSISRLETGSDAWKLMKVSGDGSETLFIGDSEFFAEDQRLAQSSLRFGKPASIAVKQFSCGTTTSSNTITTDLVETGHHGTKIYYQRRGNNSADLTTGAERFSSMISMVQDRNNNKTIYTRASNGQLRTISWISGGQSSVTRQICFDYRQTSQTTEVNITLKDLNIHDLSAGEDLSTTYRVFVNGSNRLRTVFSPSGEKTTISYRTPIAGQELIENVESPKGLQLKLFYNADARLDTKVEENGFKTIYTYRTDRVITETSQGKIVEYFNADGRLTNIADGVNPVTKINRDEWGRVVRIDEPSGYVRRFYYTQTGSVYKEAYNIQKVIVDSPSTEKVKRLFYTYDSKGNIIKEIYLDLHSKQTTTFEYSNGFNLLSKVTNEYGTFHYDRDDRGNVIAIRNAAGKTLETIAYDPAGRILRHRDRFGLTETFTYHADGELARHTEPSGAVTVYEKYHHGHPRRITYADGIISTASVDQEGRVTWRKDHGLNGTKTKTSRIISKLPMNETKVEDILQNYDPQTSKFNEILKYTTYYDNRNQIYKEFETSAYGTRLVRDAQSGHVEKVQESPTPEIRN